MTKVGAQVDFIQIEEPEMSQSGVEMLLDRWESDLTFREAIRHDPEAAVRASGVSLSDDEWGALRAIDWSQSDEALSARTSKAG
jgi:hypothetical protein